MQKLVYFIKYNIYIFYNTVYIIVNKKQLNQVKNITIPKNITKKKPIKKEHSNQTINSNKNTILTNNTTENDFSTNFQQSEILKNVKFTPFEDETIMNYVANHGK